MKKSTNAKNKQLNDLTLAELWQLFPIKLTPHNKEWRKWYKDEQKFLEPLIDQMNPLYISHIGSTAVPSIWAKPIIDILIELPKEASLKVFSTKLESFGYICMNANILRMSLNKGYTIQGFAEKVFHLHLRYLDDNDELYFRDYLLEYPEIALNYQQLKLQLWQEFEYDRDMYTRRKSSFIRKYTDLAKAQFPLRYRRLS
jgi:GrpB-like predicted nucleotidyltransferase (UPF0157 family)